MLAEYLEGRKQIEIKPVHHDHISPSPPPRNSQESLQGPLRFLEHNQKTTGVNEAAKPGPVLRKS